MKFQHDMFAFHDRMKRSAADHMAALADAAAGQLPDHERVGQHGRSIEQRDQAGVGTPQMVDPDRGVDEDQAPRCGRRRGAAWRAG